MKKQANSTKIDIKKPCHSEEECSALKNQLEEIKAKYMRALADYQNLERRTQEQIRNIYKSANKELLLKIIDILDQMEQANIFIEHDGLKLIIANVKKILSSEKVTPIEVINKSYDPHTAECIEVVNGEQDNQVVREVRKGYKLHDTLLRPSRVVVSKKAN